MEKKKLLLISIVVLAFLVRFIGIDTNPPALTWDEVAWGYNAYTLGIDGRDEFGRLMPLDYLESFGDYKPPLYAYLTVIPVKLFGLTAFAVRFPSAFLGSLTILITYFLVYELFYSTDQKKKSKIPVSHLALVTSFVLAISPWHINLSRAAFEANVATFFIISGTWLFLYSVRKKSRWLLISGIVFVLSLYTFNTARIFVPLLGLLLLAVHTKKLISMKWITIVTAITVIIISIPFIGFALTPQAKLRYNEVNIFSDVSIVEKSNSAMNFDYNVTHKGGYCPECDPVSANEIPVWSRIIHNRRFLYVVEFMQHYLHHFRPSFLFIEGDGNPKFSTQDVGQLYMWSAPFLVIGFFYLLKERRGLWWLVPVWLLVGIIPAATARETPHALRIETTLPTYQILIAYGLLAVWLSIRDVAANKWLRKTLYGIIFLIISANVLYYFHSYYAFYPKEYSEHWQYGYKEAVAYAEAEKGKYDAVIFTTSLGRPHAYVLFYTQFDPKQFRSTAQIEREVYGFVHINQFDNYYFTDDTHTTARQFKHPLVIDIPTNVPDKVPVIRTFNLLNGKPALVAYTYSL